jgi:hypothetical protein
VRLAVKTFTSSLTGCANANALNAGAAPQMRMPACGIM